MMLINNATTALENDHQETPSLAHIALIKTLESSIVKFHHIAEPKIIEAFSKQSIELQSLRQTLSTKQPAVHPRPNHLQPSHADLEELLKSKNKKIQDLEEAAEEYNQDFKQYKDEVQRQFNAETYQLQLDHQRIAQTSSEALQKAKKTIEDMEKNQDLVIRYACEAEIRKLRRMEQNTRDTKARVKANAKQQAAKHKQELDDALGRTNGAVARAEAAEARAEELQNLLTKAGSELEQLRNSQLDTTRNADSKTEAALGRALSAESKLESLQFSVNEAKPEIERQMTELQCEIKMLLSRASSAESNLETTQKTLEEARREAHASASKYTQSLGDVGGKLDVALLRATDAETNLETMQKALEEDRREAQKSAAKHIEQLDEVSRKLETALSKASTADSEAANKLREWMSERAKLEMESKSTAAKLLEAQGEKEILQKSLDYAHDLITKGAQADLANTVAMLAARMGN